MPDISGLYLAEQIINIFENIKIVFVTAFDKYAINAFEVNAIDYLLKPASTDRMDKCISKLSQKESTKSENQNFFRCHKSCLINLDKIERLLLCIGYTYDVFLRNSNKKIPVSKNKVSLLKQLLEY